MYMGVEYNVLQAQGGSERFTRLEKRLCNTVLFWNKSLGGLTKNGLKWQKGPQYHSFWWKKALLKLYEKNGVISTWFGLRIHSTRMIQMMKNIYFLEVSSIIPFWNHKPKAIWMVMKTRVAMTTMTLTTITMTKFSPNF